jgi:hypothetical protein
VLGNNPADVRLHVSEMGAAQAMLPRRPSVGTQLAATEWHVMNLPNISLHGAGAVNQVIRGINNFVIFVGIKGSTNLCKVVVPVTEPTQDPPKIAGRYFGKSVKFGITLALIAATGKVNPKPI